MTGVLTDLLIDWWMIDWVTRLFIDQLLDWLADGQTDELPVRMIN